MSPRYRLLAVVLIGILVPAGIVWEVSRQTTPVTAAESGRVGSRSDRAIPVRVAPARKGRMKGRMDVAVGALGTGVGSELRHLLGLAMVGGLLPNQPLTLSTTPVIYLDL